MIPIPEEAFLVVDEEGRYVKDGKKYKLFVGLGQPDERTAQLMMNSCFEINVTL